MGLRRILTTIAAAFVLASNTGNVSAQTIDDEGWWSALFVQGDVEWLPEDQDTRWRYWFDAHARFGDDADVFATSIIRPGLGYKLTENTTVWAGYGWIHNRPIGGGADFDENRIWQQITWGRKFGDFNLGLRSRFEQRFLETGNDTGLRYRQFAALRAPITADKKLTAVVWDEVFIHLNDVDFGPEAGFDQNRVFAGFGWNPDPSTKSRIEVGYLNVFINSRTGADRSNHILSVNVFLQ